MSNLEPTTRENIAKPTPEGRLLSAFVEAFVATRSKSEALAFLRQTAQILADREERDAVVVRLRKSDRERNRAEAKADTGATAIFRFMLEACVARLNDVPDDEDT